MRQPDSAVTLIELIVAIVLIGLLILAFSSIEMFSRYHLITSDKRAKVQNEVSHALEHITKAATTACGNETITGQNSIVITSIAANTSSLRFYVDKSNPPDGVADTWVGYIFQDATAAIPYKNTIVYCSNCTDSSCATCSPAISQNNIVANRITSFVPSKPLNPLNVWDVNYITVRIDALYDPTQAASSDNPGVSMTTTVNMPCVSTN